MKTMYITMQRRRKISNRVSKSRDHGPVLSRDISYSYDSAGVMIKTKSMYLNISIAFW